MNEDPKIIAELRDKVAKLEKTNIALQEEIAAIQVAMKRHDHKTESRIVTLEVSQSPNYGTRLAAIEDQNRQMQGAIDLLKQQMANIHHTTQ